MAQKGVQSTEASLEGASVSLLTNATAVGPGPWVERVWLSTAHDATVTGTGTVTATVDIEVSLDGVNPIDKSPLTITLSGTGADTDGDLISAPWPWVRANVTAISGTGAAVSSMMGG